ncbi:hypothetical protein [Hydrogenophaga defluvii]|uniref:Uncharacterized protein n=1 Tax=Hydrogenophaga defluvii TaxID=249410 RepID=A0ABW2SD71_9BURK
MQTNIDLSRRLTRALPLTLVALLAACSLPPSMRPGTSPADGTPTAPPTAKPPPPAADGVKTSYATDPRSYRRDAATHLYSLNTGRIFVGKLPPLLYAVGVMQVELDGRGHVRHFSWLRAPKHAPEVMAEIERTVRRAAPFPAPARLGKVTYTETWLWDKSGRFQLDTLTEGQRSEL